MSSGSVFDIVDSLERDNAALRLRVAELEAEVAIRDHVTSCRLCFAGRSCGAFNELAKIRQAARVGEGK